MDIIWLILDKWTIIILDCIFLTILGSVSTEASSNSAASSVQSSSRTVQAATPQSSNQYQTMSLINGMYHIEVDVQVSVFFLFFMVRKCDFLSSKDICIMY